MSGNLPSRLVRARAKGRFEPLAIQISRQTDAIEKHERQIATHTAIQSWTNIITLFFGVITTVALIWIAWQQAKQSQRQVDLEYAKISPQFNIKLSRLEVPDYFTSIDYFSKDITLTLDRGEAEISRIDIVQDIDIAIVPAKSGAEHINCVFRVDNIYAPAGGVTALSIDPRFARIAGDPVEDLAGSKGTMIVSAGKAWVKVHFIDIFGEDRDVQYEIKFGKITKSITNEMNDLYTSEVVTTKLDENPTRERLVLMPEAPPKTEECKKVLDLRQGMR